MKQCVFLGIIMVWLASCSSAKHSFRPGNKLPVQAMQHDMDLLKKILETKHPSLYWYTPKDSIDQFYNTVYTSLTDSLTELQFRNRISWFIAKINCGHTQVRFSKAYAGFYNGKRLPQFPLSIKVWGDSMVVVNNFLKDSVIKRGTIITSINGVSNRPLLDSMYSLIAADGYTNSFKEQLASFYFTSLYKSTFGVDSTFSIGYVDSTGARQTTVLKYFRPQTDSLERARIAAMPKIKKRDRRKMRLERDRNLSIDTTLNTAFLSVNTFSNARLKSFFRQSFKTIHKNNIANVVVDVRQNSGGDIFSSIRLLQYLTDKGFTVADTVAAIDRSCKYHQYIKPWLLYWLSMHFTGRKQSDGRIHFRYFERHVFSPKRHNHFNGNIYLLTGGYTFSAASMFTDKLKGQKNVTIVGEETGGASYGNTAVHLPEITLPNSGVRIVIPLYRMVFSNTQPKNGRGVFPDVEVLPSSQAIKNGVDVKMETVKQLIKEKATVLP